MQFCLFTSISSFVSVQHASVQVNGQETEKLDTFFLLGFLLTHGQKKVRPFLLTTDVKQFWEDKRNQTKSDLTLETTSPNSQPSMSTLGLQILQGEMLNFGSNLKTNNFMLSPFANK